MSNELGAGRPRAARLALFVMVIMSIIEGLIVATATILVRFLWGRLYSNDEEVVRYVAKMMFLLALSDFLDGFQCVLSGIFINAPLVLLLFLYYFVLNCGKYTNRSCERLWMAKHVFNHKSWSLLFCGTSLRCTLCFCITYGRRGNILNFRTHSWISSETDFDLFNILEMQGLWMGIICGLLVQVIVLITVNLFTDWNKEVRNIFASFC